MKKDEIKHIAEISKLHFSDEELDGIVKRFFRYNGLDRYD